MEMDNLLDLLATARANTGVVGITQKPREEQGAILRRLIESGTNEMDNSVEAVTNKRKGDDPGDSKNTTLRVRGCKECNKLMTQISSVRLWNGAKSCHEYRDEWICHRCDGKRARAY